MHKGTSLPVDVEIMPLELVVDEVNVIQQASCSSTCDAVVEVQASRSVTIQLQH